MLNAGGLEAKDSYTVLFIRNFLMIDSHIRCTEHWYLSLYSDFGSDSNRFISQSNGDFYTFINTLFPLTFCNESSLNVLCQPNFFETNDYSFPKCQENFYLYSWKTFYQINASPGEIFLASSSNSKCGNFIFSNFISQWQCKGGMMYDAFNKIQSRMCCKLIKISNTYF